MYIDRQWVTMSFTITVTGNESELSADFNPVINLEGRYEIGLTNFESFNAVPNIDEKNNKLYYGVQNNYITIPTGSYEIQDLNEIIKKMLPSKIDFRLSANNNTLKSLLYCNEQINFKLGNSFESLLGFDKEILPPNIEHESKNPVEIIKLNAINIECNIATGSYNNGELSHIIHQFFPSVPPGFRIVEIPHNILYFPIITNSINSITFKILDQDMNLINLRGETVSIRAHLRKCF